MTLFAPKFSTHKSTLGAAGLALLMLFPAWRALAQSPIEADPQAAPDPHLQRSLARADQGLESRVRDLEQEVHELKNLLLQLQAHSAGATPEVKPTVAEISQPAGLEIARQQQSSRTVEAATTSQATAPGLTSEDRKVLEFLHETTVNFALDGYYEYNFNAPVGRVNLLRAYDVLSNNFSLNQADAIFEHAPNVEDGRRWGARLDLQFGQATDTSQGNPMNEPRPEIYRNIFQAYGTYVVPLGKGLTVDFGKWSSSLGIEGNYTKDQLNYSRSFYFDFLPFYHLGVRASYPASDRWTLNYWVVNGTNQAEATNGFKDQLFGFVRKVTKNLTWTSNYYYGQEHPDRMEVSVPIYPIPVQPGLNFVAITPAPDGRTHIFDNYGTWQATARLSLALEGDYEIERLWRYAAPGRSSAPSHVGGGSAYIHYQLSPKCGLAGRTEYLSDRGGLFSGLTQALKEDTLTFDYQLAEGLLMRYEWRRDYSNQPTFLTSTQGRLTNSQQTAAVGVVWWWGRKEGAW